MLPAPWPNRAGDWLPIVFGALGVALGSVVMVGWLIHSEIIVQLLPGLVPMQFNTALGLAGGGAALICQVRGHRRSAWIAAALPLLLGAVTLLQTYGGMDLHIDQLFVQSFAADRTEFPGRMSVNSAVTFLIAGAGLALPLAARPGRAGILLLAATLSATAAGISFNALFGYASGVTIAYGWTSHAQMAVHTASGFLLLSLGAFARAWNLGRNGVGNAPAWIAVPVVVLSLLPSVGVWQALREHELRRALNLMQVEAESVARSVRSDINQRVLALQRMARSLELEPEPTRDLWQRRTENALRFLPGFKAIEYIDARGTVRWVVPELGNEAVVHIEAAHDTVRRKHIELAKITGSPSVTPLVPLVQGGMGFLVYVPFYRRASVRGMLAGVFRFEDLLRDVSDSTELRSLGFSVSDEGSTVYSSLLDRDYAAIWGRTTPVYLFGHTWRVTVWPTSARARSMRSDAPQLALVLGIVLALLLGVAVHSDRSSRVKTHKLAATNERITREIAERRRAEENFRQLVEMAPTGILVTDVKGRIALVNSRLLEYFGYPREELLGEPVHMLLPLRSREVHESNVDAYTRSPTSRPMGTGRDFHGRRKDGTEFPVDISLTPIESGNGTRIIASVMDMSDRVEAESALQHSNEALQAVNQELESFAYSVSHDLRQPLRAMGGFAQMLVEDHAKELDDQGRDYLGRIQAAAHRMGQLIDALLRLSRITRADIEYQTVDLTQLAWEIVAELEDGDAQRAVSWRIDDGLTATGDPQMLRVALQNLISNAWKFTANVPDARIEVGRTQSNGASEFFVRDNGAGFDMAYSDKLFGAFQRLHGAAEYPGTGIGLATTQRILRRHGGRIRADATVGAGATFYFTV